MKRRFILPLALVVVFGLFSEVRAAKLGPENVKAIEDWLATIDRHAPGREDEALARVAALTYDDRSELTAALPVFFSALLGRIGTPSNESEARVGQLGTEALRTLGASRFIARAAVLHGDAVIFGPHLTVPPFDPRDSSQEDGQLVMSSDGEYQGLSRSNWQGKFARDLLDRMPPRPTDSAFVARWYHAISAYLIANRRYGEAASGLRRAAEMLPNDPSLLFDRACLAEAMGLPRNAQVLMDPRAETTDSGNGSVAGGGRSGGAQTSRARSVQFTESATNAEAERLFRRVLEVEPSRADARVRLGRLLIVRRRYAEAEAELARALAPTPSARMAYLAHLFAGRASARLGRPDVAAVHVESALTLFPDAQSALFAKSQLALQRADVRGALVPMDRLASKSVMRSAEDPWASYEAGVGLHQANTLLATLWSSAAQ